LWNFKRLVTSTRTTISLLNMPKRSDPPIATITCLQTPQTLLQRARDPAEARRVQDLLQELQGLVWQPEGKKKKKKKKKKKNKQDGQEEDVSLFVLCMICCSSPIITYVT
jgi:hypothetical protein